MMVKRFSNILLGKESYLITKIDFENGAPCHPSLSMMRRYT